jgi:hypothetical protein
VHTLGAVLGCFISIPTMSLLGRRGAALYVMTLAYLLGYLLIGCAQNVEMIIIGEIHSFISISPSFISYLPSSPSFFFLTISIFFAIFISLSISISPSFVSYLPLPSSLSSSFFFFTISIFFAIFISLSNSLLTHHLPLIPYSYCK